MRRPHRPTGPKIPSGNRVYAIGDIHGRIDLMAELITLIRRDNDLRLEATVTIILTGDLIDRGPSSADLVEVCQVLAARYNRFIVLKGNHEAVMVDALTGSLPALAFWLRYGGSATLASWGVPMDLLLRGPSLDLMVTAKERVAPGTIKWLRNLPISHRLGNCLFVHAGIRPGIPLSKQAPTDLLWIRDEFTDSGIEHPFIIIHGHSIDEAGPRLQKGRLGIDTGAYRTGRLAAIGIEGEDFWSLIAERQAVEACAGAMSTLEENAAAIFSNQNVPAPTGESVTSTRSLAVGIVLAICLLGTGVLAKYFGYFTNVPPRMVIYSAEPDVRLALPQRTSRPRTLRDVASTTSSPLRVFGEDAVYEGKYHVDRGLHLPSVLSSASSVEHRDNDHFGTRGQLSLSAVSNRTRVVVRPSRLTSISVPTAPTRDLYPANTGDVVGSSINLQPALSSMPSPVEGLVIVAHPITPMSSSEATKKRVKAVDAIRLLRRQ